MTPKTANIHFSDLRRNIEGGFGLCGNGFFYNLLSVVFLTAILLGLDMDGKLPAVAKQADQHKLQDHHFSIKFLEDCL